MQPIIQYGVLVYANTDKTKLLQLEMKVRRLIRIIFYEDRMDSITEIMHDIKIYTVREFFAYEVLKLTGKIIQKECQVETLRYFFTKQELNLIFSKRKTNQKLSINRNKLNRGSIIPKIRKMFNFVINFFLTWVNFLKGASRFQLNSFNHNFLDNYILGNTILLGML